MREKLMELILKVLSRIKSASWVDFPSINLFGSALIIKARAISSLGTAKAGVPFRNS